MKHLHLLALLCAWGAALNTNAALAAEPPSAVMPKKHLGFFDNYCLKCHDAETTKGEVDLENLTFDLSTIESAELWQKVLNAMNSGEMPPEKKKRPTSLEKADFLEDLSARLVAARQILSDSGGVITLRRLNRREYANTLRALLGVEIDASELPNDSTSDGFDTSGSSLFFSSDQFEKYLSIARRAMDDAFVTGPKPETQRTRIEAEQEANPYFQSKYDSLYDTHQRYTDWQNSDKPVTRYGFTDEARAGLEHNQYLKQAPTYKRYIENPLSDTGALLIYSNAGGYIAKTSPPNNATSGDYILRVKIGVLEGAPNTHPFIELGQPNEGPVSGELSLLDCRRVTGARSDPQIMEFPIAFSQHSPRSFGVRERMPNNSKAGKKIYQDAQKKTDFGPDPSLWIDWFEWEGPIVERWPPASHQAIFFEGPGADESDSYARAIIERFGARAFRTRKPSRTFVDRLMGFYRDRRDAGEPFTEALKEPLSILLASPGFLYLAEPSPESESGQHTPGTLSPKELAVRLAYFLWSAPPDTELLKLARKGKLADPAILREQTNRLLTDDRAWAFVEGFTHQWLTMERLDFFQFNTGLYAEFDDSVRHAARNEIYHNIHHLLRANAGLGALLNADYVMVNELLADYYGIQGVRGHEFRPVRVPDGLPRGGLLGTAAVLAMGSDGERSSPVERGAWVMRKLLNDPPPPAPANVPQLSRFDGEPLPARDLQTAHMEEPQCAQCHRKIDPIGFGLENFDAAGRWRATEMLGKLRGIGVYAKDAVEHPIDPSGTLPNGAPFNDFFEMRERIAEHQDDFARGFTEALIEYGLGRPYGFTDLNLADHILTQTQDQNHAMRAFIHGLVQSEAFQRK